ncbi:MAG: hypothetical protein ACRCTZ_18285 [Sarcina sp.]
MVKGLNFKVRCIGSVDSKFTIGKVYDVKDGTITSNTGYKFSSWSYSVEENEEIENAFKLMNEWFKLADFELVECDDKTYEKYPKLENGNVVMFKDEMLAILLDGKFVTNEIIEGLSFNEYVSIISDYDDELKSRNFENHNIVKVLKTKTIDGLTVLVRKTEHENIKWDWIREEKKKSRFEIKGDMLLSNGRFALSTKEFSEFELADILDSLYAFDDIDIEELDRNGYEEGDRFFMDFDHDWYKPLSNAMTIVEFKSGRFEIVDVLQEESKSEIGSTCGVDLSSISKRAIIYSLKHLK